MTLIRGKHVIFIHLIFIHLIISYSRDFAQTIPFSSLIDIKIIPIALGIKCSVVICNIIIHCTDNLANYKMIYILDLLDI